MYLIVAIIAAIALAVGWAGRMQLNAMLRTVTRTCAELTAQGPFSTRCEVTGTVRPAGGRILTAPFSGTPCVWYRLAATTLYEGGGKNPFFKDRSPGVFELWDGTGVIEIVPGDTNVHGAAKSFDRKLTPAEAGDLPASPGAGGVTHYHYEEWTLPADSPLYARGTATFDGRRLFMRSPTEEASTTDPFILSTRTEKQLRRRAFAVMAGGYGLGAALVVLAAILAIRAEM